MSLRDRSHSYEGGSCPPPSAVFPGHGYWIEDDLAFQNKDLYEQNLNLHYKPPRNQGLFDFTAWVSQTNTDE